MELIKNSNNFEDFLKKFRQLENDKVEIGWFESQGKHKSGLSFPKLARVHRNGIRVRKRDVLRLAITDRDPKKDPKTKALIRKFARGRLNKKQFFESLGRTYRDSLMKAFGDTRLGVTSNPTPLIDTREWKRSTVFRIKSEGRLRKK